MPTVRHRDGIHVALGDGRTLVADARRPAGDVNVLSHAHGDHLFANAPGTVVCSELTACLATVRRGSAVEAGGHPAVELHSAGHVAGSRAALVETADGTVLYTGDVSTRSRFFLEGFDPPDADVLVVESTYGEPGYVFPPQAALEGRIVDWLDDEREPVLLFGYLLGRAQALQLLVGRSDRQRLFVTDSIARTNAPIADARGVGFGAEPWDDDVELGPSDALVLPSNQARRAWVDRLRESTGAVAAGFSGWAVDDSFRYRGNYDVTFPLSDHCDFGELVALVEAVDPDRVYTHHGFAEAFARHLTNRGFEATALVRNQSSLADF